MLWQADEKEKSRRATFSESHYGAWSAKGHSSLLPVADSDEYYELTTTPSIEPTIVKKIPVSAITTGADMSLTSKE